METKIFISCSRKCKEKTIIKKIFENKLNSLVTYDKDYNVYDCEDTPTLVERETKQTHINETEIANSDWFILICPIGWVGEHTYEEYKAALKHQKGNGYPLISILSCENPEAVRKKLGIGEEQPTNTYSIEKLLNKAKKEYQREKKDYLVTYRFLEKESEHEYDNFRNKVNSEIERVIKERWFFFKTRTSYNLKAKDVFYDESRIRPENGFDAGKYVSRRTDDTLRYDVESSTVVIVHGRPASGKSRAVYEFLKKLCQERVYPIRSANDLRLIVEDININLEKLKSTNWHIYIVCDQLDTLLSNNNNNYDKIREFSSNLRKLGWKFIATCTDLDFKKINEIFRNQDFTYSDLTIPPINEEFLTELKNLDIVAQDTPFQDNKVLGEYILGFKEYQQTVIDNLNTIKGNSADLVKDFFKAIQILKVFRHLDKLPLCLIAMMLRNKHTAISDFPAAFRSILEVLIQKLGIISLQSNSPYYTESDEQDIAVEDIAIELEKLQEYDKEKMITIVDPTIIIMIENDYIFEKLITGEEPILGEHLYVNFNDPNARKNAMNWFYNAFSEHQAVSTLRRILVRNPTTNFKNTYDSNLNQNVSFVGNKLHSLYQTLQSETSFNDLISMWIGRHNSYKAIVSALNKFENTNFSPDYITVGEILGAAKRKSGEQRGQLIQLAENLEKNINKNKGYLPSLYIMQRRLDLKKTVTESLDYIKQNEKNLEYITGIKDNEEKMLADYYLYKIKTQLITKIASSDDFTNVIAFLEEKGIEYNHLNLLIKQADAFFDWFTRQKYIENLWEYITNPQNKVNSILNDRFIVVMYYILDNSKQYLLAKDIYKKGIEYAKSKGIEINKEENYKLMNTYCNQCRNFDFFHLYNDFFERGELKDKNISLILRNTILKKAPTFTDTMSLLPKLFDSQNYKPDQYTVIAVSGMVSKNGKRYKLKKNFDDSPPKNNNDYLENIISIFHIELFKGIDFSEIAIFGSFLQNCETYEQVDKLNELMEKRRNDQFHSKPWDNLISQPEALSVLINCSHLSMQEAHKYIRSYIIRFSDENEILPDPFNAYARFLWDRRTEEEFREYRDLLKTELQKNSLWNKILKDSYFYSSYFKLYPEEWLTINNEVYSISEKLTSLDSHLFDGRIVSSTLIGSLYLSEGKEITERIKTYRFVEKWWLDNYEEIKANYSIVEEIKSAFGDNFNIQIGLARNNHGSKNKDNFKEYKNISLKKYTNKKGNTSENIESIRNDIKGLGPINFPSISSIHSLLRNDYGNLCYSTEQLFEIINIIFKERRFEILPSVYSSLLLGIYNYMRHKKIHFGQTQKESIKIISEHGIDNYNLENNLLLSYLIYIYPFDEERGILKNKLKKARKLPFKGIILLTALINKGLYDNDLLYDDKEFSETAKSIKEYIELSKLLSKTHGEGSANFLSILLTKERYPTIDHEKADAIILLFDSLKDENMNFLRIRLSCHRKAAKEFLFQCLNESSKSNAQDLRSKIEHL